MNGPAVEVIPVGGVGRFGMNCTVLRAGEEMIVVDAGVMFPSGSSWGVEAILPDLRPLFEAGARPAAIVLTHGHDDHIAGVPHLAEQTDCPIYGSDFTIRLLAEMLKDRGVNASGRLVSVRARQRVEAGSFAFEFLHVTHSVPGSFALAIDSPAGTIVHSADFKLDPTPVDGITTDLARLRERGDQGVRLLLLDSTNAGQEGSTESERRVGEAFGRILQLAPRRVFATTFASHIHRVQQFLDCAARSGRKTAVVGRRMGAALQIAREMGRLRMPPGALLTVEEAMDLPPERTLIIAGGSQAEPLSAMRRIARDEHPKARVERGDTVVHSARSIPGNEVPIARMLDDLARRGTDVLAGQHGSGLHVSGHASRGDLATLIDAVRPEAVLPVHGAYRQILECARMVASLPRPPRSILMAENGDVVRLEAGGSPAAIGERISLHPILVDRAIHPIEEEVIRERRHLGADGILVPVILLDGATGRLHRAPEILSRGFSPPPGEGDILKEAARLVAEAVESPGPVREDSEPLAQRVTNRLRSFIRRRGGKRPLVAPLIREI